MPSVQYDGVFTGSATTPGAANSTTAVLDTASVGTAHVFADKIGGIYYIDGNGNLAATADTPYTSNALLTRPDAEAKQDQSIEFFWTYVAGTKTQAGAVLRRQGNNWYWMDVVAGSGNWAVGAYKIVGGSFNGVTGGGSLGYAGVDGHRYRARVKVAGISPTTFTVNVFDLDGGTPSTPVATQTFTDSEAGLQSPGTCGVQAYGSGGNGSVRFNRIIINDESAGGPALASGTASTSSVGSGTATVATTPATGGTGSIGYQWHRSTTSGFTPGGGTLQSGATNLSYVATGLTNGTTYYFKCVATDAASATVTSNQTSATPAASPTPTLAISPTTATSTGSAVSLTVTRTNSSSGISATVTGGGSISTSAPTAGTPFAWIAPTSGSGTASVSASMDSLTVTCTINYSISSGGGSGPTAQEIVAALLSTTNFAPYAEGSFGFIVSHLATLDETQDSLADVLGTTRVKLDHTDPIPNVKTATVGGALNAGFITGFGSVVRNTARTLLSIFRPGAGTATATFDIADSDKRMAQ